MSINLTLNNVASLQDTTTAVNTINTNSSSIVSAFTNALSTVSSTPNSMNTTLDMNSNQIINLPAPSSVNSPLRLADIPGGSNITINTIPSGGTTGQLLIKNSNTNYDTVWSSTPTLSSVLNGSAVLTFPVSTDTLVGRSTVDTLSNKTIASPVFSGTLSGTYTIGGNFSLNTLILNGATSGSTTVQTQPIASGVLSLPATTDTLIGRATTDTLTNKTLDTAGVGNVFKINGIQISAATGTGSAVLASSPTLVTPILGAATGTSLALTGFLSSGTLSQANLHVSGTTPTSAISDTSAAANTKTWDWIPSGGSLQGRAINDAYNSASNWIVVNRSVATATSIIFPTGNIQIGTTGVTGTLAFTGATSGSTSLTPQSAASGVLTLPAVTDTLIGKATTDTLTNKTYDTAGAGNVFKINGTQITSVQGTGAVLLSTISGQLRYAITGINFNSANTDNSILITLPIGVSRYVVSSVRINNASASISTATAGVFTAAGGGGVAICANQALTITTASTDTNNNTMSLTQNNASTQAYNDATLFFRVGTAQGSAATADVIVDITPLT